MPLPVILAVASVVIGAIGVIQSVNAANKAEELARENAENERRENEEAMRRQKLEDREAESLNRARAAASGVTLSGSTQSYLDKQKSTNDQNRSWMQTSGDSRASMTEKQGSYTETTG